MKRHSRPALALAALAALAILSSACSSAATPANAADTVRLASEKTENSDSVAFTMAMKMSGMPSAESLDMKADGVYDLKAKQAQMSMDMLGMKVQAVVDGDDMYMKMPLLGDGWYHTRADIASATSGTAFEDPTKILDWLTKVGNDVKKQGSEDIRGELADHYSVNFNLRQAADEMKGDQKEAMNAALDLMGNDTFPVDIWVNRSGFPVRLEYAMDFPGSDIKELKGVTATYTLEYKDWGKPVSIKLPDESEVHEMGDLKP
jgi:hypothetical protein